MNELFQAHPTSLWKIPVEGGSLGNNPKTTSPTSQGKSPKPTALIRLHLEFNQISPPTFLPRREPK